MSQPYLTQDLVDEAQDAYRSGVPLTTLAGRLRATESHLAMLLGIRDRGDEADDNAESDLWAADRLTAQL